MLFKIAIQTKFMHQSKENARSISIGPFQNTKTNKGPIFADLKYSEVDLLLENNNHKLAYPPRM